MAATASDERAREIVADAIDHARAIGDPALLFGDTVLACFRVLQLTAPDVLSAELAKLEAGTAREMRRRLYEFERHASKAGPTGPEKSDWPGCGSIDGYLDAPAPPRRDFVKDRLPANRAAVIAGIGGSSKTRFEYHLGTGGVIGRLPWPWQIERTGSAALVLTEDTAEDVHRTVWAMAEAMRLSADERALLASRLYVFPLAGFDSRLLMSVGGDLVENGKVAALIDALRALPPPLVFVGLDPALALTDGDELDQAHQRRLGELVDRIAIELDACVMLATHAGKSLANAEEIGSHTARGGGALTDAVRAEYVLRTMTASEARSFGIDSIEERKAHVQLVATKGNALPPAAFAPVWLRRGSGGVLEAADLVPQTAPAIGPREVRALEVLRDLAAVSAPRLGAWRDACLKVNLLTGATDRAREKAMDRIRDALLAARLIEPGATRGFYVPRVAE
jgi:hypothetical protein